MTIHIDHPATPEEAAAVLAGSPVPFDSPTHHRYRGAEHLAMTFDSGRRRPDRVWVALDDDGNVLATVAGLASGPGVVLDHWSARDPAALAAVLEAATVDACALPEAEACLFVPADSGAESAGVAPWVAALREAGWELLVERHHYEFEPESDLAAGEPARLRLESLRGADDPRLSSLLREVLRDSLDAHDRDLVERVGLDAATEESRSWLLEADPWECVRLAFADGADPVGYVSWRLVGSGRGFLLSVGVAAGARGRGYGTQLVALATRALTDAGAVTLIADTDAPNLPMVRAFERVGWPPTETRLDFVRP